MNDEVRANLIIRFLANEATPEEQSELLEWVDANPENQRIFREFADLWNRRMVHSNLFNLENGLAKLNEKINSSERQAKTIKFPWVKAAAAVVILLVAFVFIISPKFFHERPVQFTEVVTEHGKQRVVVLSDSTVVQLNGGAVLRYPLKFTNQEREVTLSGEAFFSVKRDESRPFIVQSGTLKTEVLGTSFNINMSSDSVVVSVATGKVRVTSQNATAVLVRNEKASYHPKGKSMQKTAANLQQELAWTTGKIIFNDTPLSSAGIILKKSYGVEIEFANEAVKNCLITGTFEGQTLEHILEVIKYTTESDYMLESKRVLIKGKGCHK